MKEYISVLLEVSEFRIVWSSRLYSASASARDLRDATVIERQRRMIIDKDGKFSHSSHRERESEK